MQAMVYTEYGSPDVLQLAEIAAPAPGDDDVLIRVYAAGLNAGDWQPFMVRLMAGLSRATRSSATCPTLGAGRSPSMSPSRPTRSRASPPG